LNWSRTVDHQVCFGGGIEIAEQYIEAILLNLTSQLPSVGNEVIAKRSFTDDSRLSMKEVPKLRSRSSYRIYEHVVARSGETTVCTRVADYDWGHGLPPRKCRPMGQIADTQRPTLPRTCRPSLGLIAENSRNWLHHGRVERIEWRKILVIRRKE
jgi:hypothetical protein